MGHFTEWMALAGTVLVGIAYVPQIVHLVKEHCSAGVSIGAWMLWLSADLLILTHSIHLGDVPFLVLGVGNIAATLLIVAFSWRYRNSLCSKHARQQAVPAKGRRGEVHHHPH
jgi:hypothetical protein